MNALHVLNDRYREASYYVHIAAVCHKETFGIEFDGGPNNP